MNFLGAALKGRKKESGSTDAAPKSAAMPGEETQDQALESEAKDPIMAIVEALKAKPELMARVQEMLSEEGEVESEEGDESEEMEGAIMGGMSEEAKPSFMSRKPKGLGERAMRMVMEKKSNKMEEKA